MAQQQDIKYQYDLFNQMGQDVIRPFVGSETVSGAQTIKALQVKEAGGQERALTHDLMGAILCHSNIKQAYKQVKQNKSVVGIDQMPVGEFAVWYAEHGENLLRNLYNGTYQPQGVKQVEIPKPNGGKRKLGIPTVTYRIIQQAIAQVLSPIYERKFFDHSYGFRPNRSAHQALRKGIRYTIQKDGNLSIAKKSVERFKEKVRSITKRNRGVKFEQIIAELTPVMRGCLNYFHRARCKSLLKSLDSWIRRKLRCYRLKQCKRTITLQQFLKSRGVETWQSWILALSGKGHWCKSGCPQSHQALNNKWFVEVGLYNLTLNYERLNN